ncbi:hypothetical protein WALSEDRAFT_69607 [Wallemia mellicola CBS 633.66]|uniref:Ribonuclease P/MRP protein subunit POP5 n=2 Tax=Wallemia mellicola TaxID=1708541 RepID=I4Y9N8_WALMC|nr:hypothetical protein WALSEDRAFT_69607 [Wallemia mellicola CBS 633.66]TIB80808.1 hypothetical protein E3Q21_03576 [Wallemia mellicola]EIM20680.1 hypothetical protein WALSEDRAFT_69607 [Wallemia mellicola CBS 633.66]TIB84848.1 hypothetical protein E3Q20_03490 [Wallemia mellicola]TIC02049.1 hypothetical protein E3Q16_03594 [Wallemia mellicola]TIC21322.1 hypothetical protein E3Q12_03520 [Wallemia mellicola]|eukprot:XP_006959213.1 hypothetical protein WALSEDRAFT_69607 [Wallemia mellicola CBS 633.66]
MVRFKNRWIIAEIIFPDSPPFEDSPNTEKRLDGKQILQSIRRNIAHNFGDHGAGSVANSLSLKYHSAITRLCIFRIAREYKDMLHAALTLTTSLSEYDVCIRVLHVSGTIRKVQEAAIRYNREAILNTSSDTQEEDLDTSKNDIMAIEN